MNEISRILIPLGAVFLVSLALEAVGRRTRLPRVTLLILFGIAAGPAGLAWIPTGFEQLYGLIAAIALGMIGFLLGGHLTRKRLRRLGRPAVWVSVMLVLVTYAVVALGLWSLGAALPLALIFAAIATATDPAATVDVINETGAKGHFPNLLEAVVAIDDIWGIIIFSLTLALVQGMLGNGGQADIMLHSAWDLGGAILLGMALGIPAAYLTGRLRDNNPILIEALGTVFLCVGLAFWLEVSYLLACVTLGCTVANRARHHKRPFHAIEGIEWPFLVVFFVLSGAMLQWQELKAMGVLGLGYVVFRIIGRIFGGYLSALPAWTWAVPLHWIGPAMLPQAGVALAMAIVSVQALPQYSQLLPVVIASTVFFELLGPIATGFSLARARRSGGGEMPEQPQGVE